MNIPTRTREKLITHVKIEKGDITTDYEIIEKKIREYQEEFFQ